MPQPTCNSSGFSEGLISVSEIDQWVDFLTNVFEWRVLYDGPCGSEIRGMWQLSGDVKARQVLLGEPNAETTQGRIRLIKFENVTQKRARPSAYAWDTGGFFDLHVQVRDLRGLYEKMQGCGWHGFTEPKRLDVSGVTIDEVLVHGPDGMAFALIERISPPFQVVDGYAAVSPAWNAPQMVSDLTSAHQFYSEGLGFKTTIEFEMPPPEDGDTLFGLPLSLGKTTSTELAFFHPGGRRGAIGSVDLLHMVGVQGRDLRASTRPPNLGLMLIRFPVKKLNDYMSAIQNAGVKLFSGPMQVNIEPYGVTTAIGVMSPEGALIEFYEDLTP
jgi:catechol 2,3-dioxygenase-like lactoylglutathione lyase family enzyme